MEGEEEILKSGVHTESSSIDGASINWLGYILFNSKLITPELKHGDKFSNIDGSITILESKGGESFGSLEVQVKKLVKKKTMISYSLKDKFVAYAKKHFESPPLLIVVDTEQEVAYWVEMNELTLSQMNGNTVRLDPQNEISKSDSSYYSQWKKILSIRKISVPLNRWKKNHQLGVYEIDFIRGNYNDLGKTIEETLGSYGAEKLKQYIFPEQFQVQENTNDTEIVRVSKNFVSKIKKEYLLPLIDFAFPVFSDGRGKQKRIIISRILKISEGNEGKMIEELIAEKKLAINENLYITPDANEVKIIQNKMIDEGIINVEDLINLFTNEGYE
ncbi:MAG: hypothetical protein UR96_C0017G0013 [candidate division WS6 bacterium GW2011_GWC1_36_11]|uniref:DUF4365 domain-containing protein n=1 Tax=candidate division WS6 bacterium GW2011_GWC1_36_11 TaxID=1619090 RepID=A0A0G0DT88_9BACT|nr:MAG: hypothetical protein UR96_C0017G0013 [candidate division WS6 bacterium GW2011_GWC1_36_11]KKQ04522.1 MAG: hypothetical protein US14_C0007G0005 [candidate division WS6 bacterium GW2011_WS6_36_26]HAM96543.1 hypothetical protein [Patescibacteria group bacterium]